MRKKQKSSVYTFKERLGGKSENANFVLFRSCADKSIVSNLESQESIKMENCWTKYSNHSVEFSVCILQPNSRGTLNGIESSIKKGIKISVVGCTYEPNKISGISIKVQFNYCGNLTISMETKYYGNQLLWQPNY